MDFDVLQKRDSYIHCTVEEILPISSVTLFRQIQISDFKIRIKMNIYKVQHYLLKKEKEKEISSFNAIYL